MFNKGTYPSDVAPLANRRGTRNGLCRGLDVGTLTRRSYPTPVDMFGREVVGWWESLPNGMCKDDLACEYAVNQNDQVAVIPDLLGNGYDFVSSVAAQRGVLKLNESPNGMPGIGFDGVDDRYLSDLQINPNVFGFDGFSIFAVIKQSTTRDCLIIDKRTANAADPSWDLKLRTLNHPDMTIGIGSNKLQFALAAATIDLSFPKMVYAGVGNGAALVSLDYCRAGANGPQPNLFQTGSLSQTFPLYNSAPLALGGNPLSGLNFAGFTFFALVILSAFPEDRYVEALYSYFNRRFGI